MGYQKRILQILTLLFATAMVCAAAVWGISPQKRRMWFGRQEVSAETKEKKRYPSEAEAWKLAGQLPLVCTPVSECYRKEEGQQGLSEELLADLQEYVRRGAYTEALWAYRDESLLIDVEELARLCPDYEELIAAEIERGRLSWDDEEGEKDIVSGIVQIYALESGGEKGAELLISQNQLCGRMQGYYPWIVLQKTEEGYLCGEANVGHDAYGRAKDKTEIAVFAWGEGEEKAYYLLQKMPEGMLWLENLTLRGDWQEKIRESYYLFEGGGRYIAREATRAAWHFFYVNGKAALTPAVKRYIEENAILFAGKLFAFSHTAGNEYTIWGDEEIAVLAKEEEKQIEEALVAYYKDIRGAGFDQYDYRVYYFMKYMVSADYNNDGSAELFFRDEEEKNILLTEENGGFKTQYVNLYEEAEAPASQMWFVEFAGKTVTFAVSMPYGEACPILSAYLIEGAKKTPLLTCQLVFGETVEITAYAPSWGFDFKDCPKLSLLPETQGASFYEEEEIKEEVREISANLQIQSAEAESLLPQEILPFIREGERELIRGNFWQYLEPYQIDTSKDSQAFCARDDWGWLYYHRDFGWAYRWEAHDGSENFLICENYYEMGFYEGTPGVARLCWFRDEGESYREEELVRFSWHDSAFMISYEGRTYCIVADTSLGVTGASGILVIALGEAGEWEGYPIFLTPETEAYEPVSLDCGDTPAVVSDYVEAEYQNMLAACRNGTFYTGLAGDGIPAAAWRDIKNRDAYYNDEGLEWGVSCTYSMWDADNDGEAEYLAAYCDYDRNAYKDTYYPRPTVEYVMYGYRDGKFVEFLLDTLEEDGAFAENDGCSYAWDLGEGCTVRRYPQQLWFEELDGVTYFFTLELLGPTHSYLLRARVIKEGAVEETGAWMLCAPIVESVGARF